MPLKNISLYVYILFQECEVVEGKSGEFGNAGGLLEILKNSVRNTRQSASSSLSSLRDRSFSCQIQDNSLSTFTFQQHVSVNSPSKNKNSFFADSLRQFWKSALLWYHKGQYVSTDWLYWRIESYWLRSLRIFFSTPCENKWTGTVLLCLGAQLPKEVKPASVMLQTALTLSWI